MQPVTIPASATAFLNLEQKTGWTKQSDPSITGPGAVTPAVWDFAQEMPAPIQPPMTLTLKTTGVAGKWSDWMCKAPPIPASDLLNCLIRASYTFDSVEGIQAWEIGRRRTNKSKITDNGQTQLVPIQGGLLEYDIVPSAAGGWKDTGIRFPMWKPGAVNEQEMYWVNDPDGALSQQYVMLNGVLQPIPASLQHIVGANLDWDATVAAFQCDANPTAKPFNATVTLSIWMW
jgi:hypothetical protein